MLVSRGTVFPAGKAQQPSSTMVVFILSRLTVLFLHPPIVHFLLSQGQRNQAVRPPFSRRSPCRARHDSLPYNVRARLLESLGHRWAEALPEVLRFCLRATRLRGRVWIRCERNDGRRGALCAVLSTFRLGAILNTHDIERVCR